MTTLRVPGAVVVLTFIITPLTGSNAVVLFGLAGLCLALTHMPVLLPPESGTRAFPARAGNVS